MAANEKSMPYYYDTVFRNVFDAVTEINLCTGRYQHTIFSKGTYGLSAGGNYAADFDGKAFSFVISCDREKVRKAFSFPELSKACVQGPSSKVCQYRIQTQDGRQKWMESRAYFTRVEAQPFAIITSKNITDIKINEHRMRIAGEYDRALRDIYDEFYELNLTQDSCRVVYHTKNKFVLPALEGTLGEVVAHVAEHDICPEDKERFLAFFNLETMKSQFAAGRENILGEFRRQWADGTFRWASYTVFPVQKAAESDEILLCFIMDIDEKKRADELLEQNRLLQKQRQLDERFRIIVQQTGTQVFEWDVETGLQYLSEDLPKMLAGNYDGRDLYTLWLADRVVHPDDADRILQCRANLFGGKSHCNMKIRLKNPKGAYLWFKICVTAVRDENDEIVRMVGTINNVDEVVKSEEALRYRAEFDPLTGLYNRQAFLNYAAYLLEKNPNVRYGVVVLDVNRFKFINDVYGYEEGNALLRYIAAVIRTSVRKETDGYCRMYGDEFAILAAYEDKDDLTALCGVIAKRVAEYALGYQAAVSSGIYVVEDRSAPVSAMCDWAALAQKTVKGSTLQNWAFYDKALRLRQLEEQEIVSQMEKALAAGQFQLYLQPKHHMPDGKIVGAEALVRWLHPEKGIILPGRFVPLFERNGFIIKMDECIWEQAFRELRRFMDLGLAPLPILVNVSRVHIYNPAIYDTLNGLAKKYGVPKNLVELELAESAFAQDAYELHHIMEQLRCDGFSFAIDDFGAGYSSLNMLKDAPVDTIKLDCGFLNESVATPKGKTVIACTIEMAKKLRLAVIAEGVEQASQAEFLCRAGCDVCQGFYFSRPMTVDEFEKQAYR